MCGFAVAEHAQEFADLRFEDNKKMSCPPLHLRRKLVSIHCKKWKIQKNLKMTKNDKEANYL